MQVSSAAVALMVKRPIPGAVKTRLTTNFTPDQAAELSWAFTVDTWRRLERWAGAELKLFADQPWSGFSELTCELEIQQRGDLGNKMYDCFERLAEMKFEKNLIIGADSPTLPLARLDDALRALSLPHDAVLGPTSDGGYYLVGCRRPQPAMFEEVAWSTAATLAETRRAFDRVGYRTTLIEPWWDVDEPADLDRLRNDPALGERTRRALERIRFA